VSTYQGEPGGPRDPATAGGYCLRICRCGTCPQHTEQARQTALLREQEYQTRVRREGERQARKQRRRETAA
jgi:hypothetical protein